MRIISYIFYNFIILPFLYLGIRIGALFNRKINFAINGRKRIFEELILNAASLDKTRKLIWFHSSSLGEFEQAKPIIERLKREINPNILVTFFSPSGYENSRKYPFADLVSYIPFDTKSNADRFIRIANPDLAIMMRYDIWPNHIWAMKNRKIPVLIADATMNKNSSRKLPFIKSFHKILFGDVTRILCVSEADRLSFSDFDIKPEAIKVIGDTRFDRVYQRSLTAKTGNLINKNILNGKKIFVAGSTWEADEDVILPAFLTLAKYDPDVILIIAPHEPTLLHLEKIENEFSGLLDTIRFSSLNSYKGERVIIVDSIGILLTLYTYAHVAFVGGSFKQNIHNVLEAAVYGTPVLFGPKIDNSQESRKLLEMGGAVLIKNKKEAYRSLRMLLSNEVLRVEKGKISFNYVRENLGATDKIIEEIYSVI